jgi:hypothetical protein
VITAEQIIQVLESLSSPASKEELFNILHKLLFNWKDTFTFRNADPAWNARLLLLKRHIPDIFYNGIGYRLMAIDFDVARQEQILLGNDIRDVNVRKLIDYLQNTHQRLVRGRHVSWSKTMRGLINEMEEWGYPKGICFIVSGNITGLDLNRASHFLVEMSKNMEDEMSIDMGITDSHYYRGDPKEAAKMILSDFGENDEVLAVMTSSLNLVKVISKS